MIYFLLVCTFFMQCSDVDYFVKNPHKIYSSWTDFSNAIHTNAARDKQKALANIKEIKTTLRLQNENAMSFDLDIKNSIAHPALTMAYNLIGQCGVTGFGILYYTDLLPEYHYVIGGCFFATIATCGYLSWKTIKQLDDIGYDYWRNDCFIERLRTLKKDIK